MLLKDVLIKYRIENCMPMKEMSEQMQISVPTLRAIERDGYIKLSVLTKGKIIKFLKEKGLDENDIGEIYELKQKGGV